MTPPPPSLPDEVLEEIFLRLPPDEPACLVRSSLASKLWLGLLSSPAFLGRYREFHGAPPMLGFLHTWLEGCGPEEKYPVPHFTPTTKFAARIPHVNDRVHLNYAAWDCRHGRVLLGDDNPVPMVLVVWDPLTGCRREMNLPDVVYNNYGAAVLCAATGCDHRAYHAAPFQVVFVGLNLTEEGECVAHAWLSLPETGDWSKSCPGFDQWGEPCPRLTLPADAFIEPMPPVLVKEALHFMLEYDDDDSVAILKYDLSSNSLSLIDAPIMGSDVAGATMLMAMSDGSLGYALVDGLMLYLWSGQMGSSRAAPWSLCTNINLGKLLPIQNHKKRLRLVGSVEASDIVFVTTDLGIYEINVKSQQWKRLWKREKFCALIPFMSFYNPQERVILSQTAHSQGMVK
ncbi:hypothetical protein ACQJBY_047194 [Aegilops geniculata]